MPAAEDEKRFKVVESEDGPTDEPSKNESVGSGRKERGEHRGGPALRDSSAAWLRWILGSITPPISPRLPA